MTINKTDYHQFLQNHALPIFYQNWWLDAVCGVGEWSVAIARKKDGQISGVLPYYLTKMKGQPVNIMPILTPQLGVWIVYPPNLSTAKKYSYEKKVTMDLVQQLPKVTYYQQNYSYRYQNAQPLHWLGFKNTIRYSYRLNDIRNLEEVYNNFAGRLRTTLRKASNKVKIENSDNVELFYHINSLSFKRQGMTTPYSLDLIKRIDTITKQHQQRAIYFAKDANDQIHATLYIVWDKHTSYNLMAGGDPQYRNSGAMQLLLWQAIQDASQRSQSFDFEGSMLEHIAFSFQSFGGQLTPYLRFFKSKNLFWSAVWRLMGKE